MITLVDLLRHGACEGGDIFRGTTDSPLSDRGWRQMQEAVAGDGGWQRVITSPLSRCRAFAQSFAAARALPLVEEPSLREIDFGAWEGRLIADIWEQDRALAEQYFRQPGRIAPAGGESMKTARDRLLPAWQSLLAQYRGQHLLLVAHGGIIRLLLAHLLAMPLSALTRLHVPHGCLTRLRISHLPEGSVAELVMHNPGGRS